MTDFTCNLLVIGQTGTGKSSLLNYVFGTDFKTGCGRPVTGQGLYENECVINGQKIRVFDSWGLEQGKLEVWENLLNEELKKHGCDRSMEEWFHSVIYCIQGGGNRVQDIDTKIISNFLNQGYRITVVLTKIDQLDEKDVPFMKKAILDGIEKNSDISHVYENNLEVVGLCSVTKKYRNGKVVTPFGKEEVVRIILNNWRKTVINKMPSHIIAVVEKEIDKWEEKEKKLIEENEEIYGYDWGKNNDLIKEEISGRAKPTFEKLVNETLPFVIKKDLESCQKVDMALCDVTIPSIDIDLPPFYSTTSSLLNVVIEVIEDLAVLPLLIKCIMHFKTDCIKSEKEKLKSVVSEIANKMKEEIRKQESVIEMSIKNALSVK